MRGPDNQAYQKSPSLWEQLCTDQHEHSKEHTQAAAHHAHEGTMFLCPLHQQPEREKETYIWYMTHCLAFTV